MDEKTLRSLIEAGSVKALHIIADGPLFHVEVITARQGALTALTGKGNFRLVQQPLHRCDPHRKPIDTRIPLRPVIVERVVAVLQFGRVAPFPVCLDFQFSGAHAAPPGCLHARG